jgi:hypothetical protein
MDTNREKRARKGLDDVRSGAVVRRLFAIVFMRMIRVGDRVRE